MRYRDVRTQVGESAFDDPSLDASETLTARCRSSKPYRLGSKGSIGDSKIRLDCGCEADVDTMKIYSECRYHMAVERLRKDLKRVEGKRTKHRTHTK